MAKTMITMEDKREFTEKVHEEAKFFVKQKIMELESKGADLNDTEKSFLEFFKINALNLKSDKEILNELYEDLVNLFAYYLDDKDENFVIYSLWVIGTQFHKEFQAYPYLYINAMKGSAKSRLLKLLAFLCDGKWITSPTESILFRTNYMLSLDEMESIYGKDKVALREILNASYKKGLTISRTIKTKKLGVEGYGIENFEPYRPIAMANINGMDNVLQDRCISIILEKSNNPAKTKLSEDFENDPVAQKIKKTLKMMYLVYVPLQKKHIYRDWNTYIKCKYEYTQDTLYTLYSLDTLNTYYSLEDLKKLKENSFFNKIDETGLYGRNLELFFPFFIISEYLGDDIFKNILNISKKINEEKNKDDEMESFDIMVIDFISKFDNSLDYHSIQELVQSFRNFSNISEEWVNPSWFGRALTRLCLINNKKRTYRGKEVILNVTKAKEKIKMFRTGEQKE